MNQSIVDLRSDTVTRPTPAMRDAIAMAEVGDDVIDVDPTVDQLEKRIAEILGKEAAIYMPSGSMTNQVAIRIHCKPGDEFICEENCHIYNYEQAAFAQLSGVVARTVAGTDGVLVKEQLVGLIRPQNDHLVRTRLVSLENTHNRASGRIQPYEVVEEICQWAHAEGLRTHLDGARLFNAVVATGIEAADWAGHFDTLSVCFSKGLGAPVGSALVGPRELIRQARRHRKVFGGDMRQFGKYPVGEPNEFIIYPDGREGTEVRVEFVMQPDMISGSDRARTAIEISDTAIVVIGQAIPGVRNSFPR